MPDGTMAAALMQTRRATPTSIDREARTAVAVASTFADVRRGAPTPAGGWSDWIERLDPAGVDLKRFSGAPMLLDHRNSTDSLAGVVEGVEIGPKGLLATVRFATSARGDEALGLVADGVLTGVSVGYRVDEYRLEPGSEPPVFTAMKWAPLELSLTPIPADDGARFRAAGLPLARQESIMDTNITDAAAAANNETITRAERTRVSEIDALITGSRSIVGDAADTIRTRAIAEGQTVDQVRAELLNSAIARSGNLREQPRPTVQYLGSQDDPAILRARLAEALACRVTGAEPSDPAKQYAGISYAEVARATLEARGERFARNTAPAALITRAISTSDFPLALLTTASRLLQNRLETDPGAMRTICARREVPDFRAGWFMQFAGIKNLEQIPEGGPIPHSPPAERGEQYQAKTFARGIGFTRQALVNDDLSTLDQMTLFGNAIISTEAAEFVKMFATNGGGWGPTLNDGVPLFHATHGNVGSGAVGTTGISAGRVVMRAQTDANGNLAAVAPRIMLVGPDNETAAEQALNQTAIATSESGRPVFGGKLELAVEPRLTGTPWWMFANPMTAPVLAFVTISSTGGNPIITQHDSANFDGVSFKLVHDFAVAPMSYVGAVRLTGT